MVSIRTLCKYLFIIAFLIAAIATPVNTQVKKQGKAAPKIPSFVLMGLSAHPDDEDGATLSYYGKIENMKVYSVFFTRGEGGQNETGSELYEELGAVRTKETLEAAKILGTEVSFLGFPDFGYSKTAKETFTKWGGKDKVLAKLVYAIRCIKPDVIVTNHDTITVKPRRQHGNHQAVGITAYEAFEKAADPKYHPEQLKDGVTPWQAHKLFFRVFSASDTTQDSLTTINVKQEFSPSVTIEDISVSALQQHRSQGLAKLDLDSIPQQYRKHRYKLIRSDKEYYYDKDDLFIGLTATNRQFFLPKNLSVSYQSEFSIHVSPSYTSAGLSTSTTEKKLITRPVILTLLNPTGSKLAVEVLAHAGTTRLFQKAYTMEGGENDRLSDTIALHLEDVPGKQHVIRFMASAKGEGVHPLKILPAHADIEIKTAPGSFAPDAFVGLVKTYDNTVEETMQSFDVHYQLIDSSMLASGNLAQFSVIVLDIRTYEFRSDAVRYSSKLLECAHKGGNLVVFYHKTRDWNGKGFSPYPIQVTSERVTEEDAAVMPLLPNHFLLTTPNKIQSEDWSGWVQERSIYLPSDDTTLTSSSYDRILGMSDEGERQPPTSLLWARYGDGSYSYISLALYRQLRNLQDGAVKLFFNLISQKKK
ncbi:MAG: PIG-L deacetylase family protein [Bacteroidota bacterium]